MSARNKNREMPPPKSVSISITGKCNLKCNYCFYANEMVGLKDLPAAIWLKFFAKLAEIGIMDISLTGGEALLRPDIFDLIDGIIANRMRYNILSNGTLIDEKLIKKFEHGKRRLRLDYIQVSIDGSCAEIHNKSRPGSFAKAIRGLKLLKQTRFPVVVRVTINRHNLNDMDNIAKLLLEDIGLKSFATNEAMPIGSGCRSDAEITLTSKQKMAAMATIGRLQRRYPGRLQAQAGPQAKRKMYAEMVHARRTGEKPLTWTMGYLSACGCVFSKIDVLHDGSIVPCCMLPSLVLGNICSDSLLDIWYHHPTMIALRERRNIPMNTVPGCEDCEWNQFCNGSCPGLAEQLTGDFNRANPEDCFRNFLKETGASYGLRA
ncbi:MAG: radical SAM protein [Candidatus Aminicenantes bacterium]|nr:radical SAM protein [Candidatus Aminicenantes bacterium]